MSLTIKLCLNLKVENMNIYKLIPRRPKPTLLTSPSWFTTLANNIIYEIRVHCLPHQSKKLRDPFFNRSMWIVGILQVNRYVLQNSFHIHIECATSIRQELFSLPNIGKSKQTNKSYYQYICNSHFFFLSQP